MFTDEHKQKEALAKMEMERVLEEKDQLSKDLSELERSFSSVVKRLDRCKEVIEGFKKVGFETYYLYSRGGPVTILVNHVSFPTVE